MDVTSLLTQLPFYANLGSVGGLLITVYAAFAQFRTRRRYLLMLRGPDLLTDLEEYGSQINRYDELSEKDRKTVLRGCRSTLDNLSKYVGLSTWQRFASLRWTLWKKWNRATVEEADEIYAEVQAAINDVKNLILEQKAEQA